MQALPSPQFDLWNFIFIGIASVGIFYSSRLFVRHRHEIGNVSLALFVMLQAITLLEYVLFWTNLIFSVHFFADISLLFPLLYGPLILIYIRDAFGNSIEPRNYLWHFAPFALLLILKVPFYASSPEFKFFHTRDIAFGVMFEFFPWVKILHMALYCWILFAAVRDNIGVGLMRRWANHIIIFFMGYTLLQAVYYILISFSLLTNQIDYLISVISCLSIFLIAWYNDWFENVRQDAVGEKLILISATENQNGPNTDPGSPKYKNSGMSESFKTKLSHDLDLLMRQEKLYRANDLRLDSVASKLNTNRHFISQIINEVFGKNFFDYLNSMRVEEAKHLLEDTSKKQLNIIQVAYSVGFNNKSTFNSVFKRITGVTPTEYRKSFSKKDDVKGGTPG